MSKIVHVSEDLDTCTIFDMEDMTVLLVLGFKVSMHSAPYTSLAPSLFHFIWFPDSITGSITCPLTAFTQAASRLVNTPTHIINFCLSTFSLPLGCAHDFMDQAPHRLKLQCRCKNHEIICYAHQVGSLVTRLWFHLLSCSSLEEKGIIKFFL